MASKIPKGSVANWDPGQGSTTPQRDPQLFSTEAADNKSSISATNEQKQFMGGKGTPKGPFGLKGREF